MCLHTCACMCVCGLCVYACVHTHMCVCVCMLVSAHVWVQMCRLVCVQRLEENIRCPAPSPPPYLVENSLIKPGTRLASSKLLQSSFVCPPQCWGHRHSEPNSVFYMGSRNLSPGPHAYIVSVLTYSAISATP